MKKNHDLGRQASAENDEILEITPYMLGCATDELIGYDPAEDDNEELIKKILFALFGPEKFVFLSRDHS